MFRRKTVVFERGKDGFKVYGHRKKLMAILRDVLWGKFNANESWQRFIETRDYRYWHDWDSYSDFFLYALQDAARIGTCTNVRERRRRREKGWQKSNHRGRMRGRALTYSRTLGDIPF